MNYKRDTLKKMAFQIYDFDSDHQICSLDLYTFLKTYEHDEECFFKAFSNDINKIESELDHRRSKQGLNDPDVTFKLRDIDDKLVKLGGRLEVKTLNEFFKLQAGVKDDVIDSDSGFSEDGDATQGGGAKSTAGRSRLNR